MDRESPLPALHRASKGPVPFLDMLSSRSGPELSDSSGRSRSKSLDARTGPGSSMRKTNRSSGGLVW